MPDTQHATSRRRSAFAVALLGALCAIGLLAPSASAAGSSVADTRAVVTYQTHNRTITNPERGTYHRQERCNQTAYTRGALASYKNEFKQTLVNCVFYLLKLDNGKIRPQQIAVFRQQAATLRAAGFKMVLRFAYTDGTTDTDPSDQPVATVLANIDQLAPEIRANIDVIAFVESGFVGKWGEGGSSANFGSSSNLTTQNWTDRKRVVDKLLSVVPNTRMVLMRTPQKKHRVFFPASNQQVAPVTAGQAFSGSAVSRLGHHNDCFLRNNTDAGTFREPVPQQPYSDPPPSTVPQADYKYLAWDTNYVAVGGETCTEDGKLLPSRGDCQTAVRELRLFNYTYLNRNRSNIYESWSRQGCKDTIEQRLGYRLALKSSTFPSVVQKGQPLTVRFDVTNTGWAAPMNPRPVNLVLRSADGAATTTTRLKVDLRKWAPGTAATVNEQVVFPSAIRPGLYDVFLSLPDASASLASRPDYAIQFANESTWDASTGWNRMLVKVRFL